MLLLMPYMIKNEAESARGHRLVAPAESYIINRLGDIDKRSAATSRHNQAIRYWSYVRRMLPQRYHFSSENASE